MKNRNIFRDLWRNKTFLFMVLPGVVWLMLFFYIPIFGNVVAFQHFRIARGGFIQSVLNSPWAGFDNFRFLFGSNAAFIITRNTVLYNGAFILLGLIVAVALAIVLSELRSKKMVKVYQTTMLLPYFLSWIIVSYFVFTFLNPAGGLVNNILEALGANPVNWYQEPRHWPFILVFIGIWKGVGYSSIIYFASIVGIDPSFYEAAAVDGATKWQQIKNITIPQLAPLITVLMILAVGNIFRADFGLFFQVPRNSGALHNVTAVLDTYIFNSLMTTGDIGMAAAAGLYQSLVGCILVVTTNLIVRRFDPDSALF